MIAKVDRKGAGTRSCGGKHRFVLLILYVLCQASSTFLQRLEIIQIASMEWRVRQGTRADRLLIERGEVETQDRLFVASECFIS